MSPFRRGPEDLYPLLRGRNVAALRKQGMVDLKQPENSRILHFIRMSLPKTPLVTQKARDDEYAAFRDWIVAAATNPKLISATVSPAAPRVGPAVSGDVIRHTRLDSVVASFERNIWSQEGRCMGCHRPGQSGELQKVRRACALVRAR